MPKILAQTGISLADIYDIEGSIVGVEQLHADEINLVHEMGMTIFSERLVGEILRGTSTDIAASTAFDITIAPPGGFYRVLGVQVLADNGGRVDRAQVSLRAVVPGREIPIFIWDNLIDGVANIRIVENGAAPANLASLVQSSVPQTMPSLGVTVSRRAGERVGNQIMFRGLSTAFGAGTVEVIALVYVASSFTTSISSVGLPLPGW